LFFKKIGNQDIAEYYYKVAIDFVEKSEYWQQRFDWLDIDQFSNKVNSISTNSNFSL
jgi:hypothetical protein